MNGLAIAAAIAIAGQAASPPARSDQAAVSRSPVLGHWLLDLGSMAVPEQARPTSVAATFARDDDGTWQITYVITARDGGVRRMTSRERPDGQWVTIEGDRTEADSVAITSPAPGTLVMGLAREGRPASVRVYSVQPGGGTMIESAASVGGDGKPLIRTFRWSRRD